MQSMKANPQVVAEAIRVYDELGIPYVIEQRSKEMVTLVLTGGRQGYLNFLALARPVKRDFLVKKIIGSTRFGKKDKIVSIKPVGEGNVVSLTTDTGNYVAWGYASRNCDTEVVKAAMDRGQWAFAMNSVVAHHHPIYDRSVAMDDTYRRALGDASADMRLFKERLKEWSASRR